MSFGWEAINIPTKRIVKTRIAKAYKEAGVAATREMNVRQRSI